MEGSQALDKAMAEPELEALAHDSRHNLDHKPSAENISISTPPSLEHEPAHEVETEKHPPAVEEPTKPSANDSSAIPNGGLQAWLQVVGGFMVLFNTFGLLNTFGIFQTYYESGALFQESSSNIAWIGSIQAWCVFSIGTITGPVFDKGYLRVLLIVGTFGIVFGHMMLSLCTEYWQVILAQGFCVGLGAGCLFVPPFALAPTYFSSKLGLAVGLTAAGSSLGGVIYPIIFYRLVDRIGFGWTVRVLGFIALAGLIIPIVFLKQRVKPPKARALIDTTVFTDVPFLIFTFGVVIGFIGLYIVLFYISYFGQASGITDDAISFYLVPILNAVSVFGRTLPSALSDKTGPFNMIVPGAISVGLLVFCLLAVKSSAGLIVLTAFYGFASGVFFSLPPVCFVHLTKDKSIVGTRIGMGFATIGFSVLIAGPGAGAILGTDVGNLNWTGTWVFAGVCALAAGGIFLGLRMWKANYKLITKV